MADHIMYVGVKRCVLYFVENKTHGFDVWCLQLMMKVSQ